MEEEKRENHEEKKHEHKSHEEKKEHHAHHEPKHHVEHHAPKPKPVFESHDSGNKTPLTDKMRENPFILSTIVLGVITLILLIGNFNPTGNVIASGDVISEEQAGADVLSFVQTQTQGQGDLVGVESFNDYFYQVNVEFQGQEIPLYLSKDGTYFTSQLTPFEELSNPPAQQTAPAGADVPKSDNPEVELFIWSYCPYGVQAQGPMAEVYSLLGDSANFKAVMYHDGHGEYENQQNKIQECIQEIAPEKYWDYAKGFVEDIYTKCGSSRDATCDKDESVKLMNSLGIDSDAVLSCVDERGDELFAAARARAQEVGVTGSPSIVINGVKASPSSRTAEAFKATICEAFNNAPETCGTQLDSTAATAAGNC